MTPTQRKAMQDAIDYIRSTADYKMGSPAACETVCDLHEALAEPEPVPLLTDDEIHDVWMIARVANEFPTVYALEFAHSRIEQLETALSECRDAMPSPAPGERQEQSWSEAIGDPLAVPAYVKAGIAAFATPPAQTPPRLTDGQMLRMWIDSTGHVDAYGSAIETAVRRQFLGRDE